MAAVRPGRPRLGEHVPVRDLLAGVLAPPLGNRIWDALVDQSGPGPGVVTQVPYRPGRHERGVQQPHLGQPGQPHRIQVGLGPARQILGLGRADQLHRQPCTAAPTLARTRQRPPARRDRHQPAFHAARPSPDEMAKLA